MKNALTEKAGLLKNFIYFIINIIAPKCCLFCRKEFFCKSDNIENFFCKDCEKKIFYIDQKNCCKNCGYPFGGYSDDNKKLNFLDKKRILCHSCKNMKNNFIIARSCFQYRTKLRHLLINFKFFFQTESIDFIGQSLLKTYLFMPKADIVCCVPITRLKLFSKGYNHASLMAGIFYKNLKKNNLQSKTILLQDLLLKNSKSSQSKTLSQQERLKKKHNFIVNKKYLTKKWRMFFSGKTILIIDDIMTTGATLNSSSFVLKKEFKNIKVECLTFARTMLY